MPDDTSSTIYSGIADLDAATTEYLDAIDEMVAEGLLEQQAVADMDAQFRAPWPAAPTVPKDEVVCEWEYSAGEHSVLDEEEGMNDECLNMTALCDDFVGTSLF